MSRSTKLIVIASNLGAIWLTATLASRGIHSVFVPTVGAFALSWLFAALLGDIVTSVVLSLLYLVPAACFVWYDTFNFSYYAIWLAALCGSLLPRAFRSGWAFPGRFAAPLAFWALVLALSWPIVVLREVDFVPAMLTQPGIAVRLPQSPATIGVWIVSVTSIALTGLLFLDWLFAAYPADGLRRFESRVIWPMFAGAVCAAVVAVYQALVDISFLNHTPFESYRRVVGTMRDANPFGSVMALWLPFAAAMIISNAKRWYVIAAWSTVLLMLGIALWASGSRIGLLAGMIGLFVVIGHAWRSLTARQLLGGLLAATIMGAAVALLVPSTTIARARSMVPSFSSRDLKDAALQLWSRDSYGTAAVQMIAEHPLVGVGVGGFLFQYGDLLYLWNGSVRPPDNAQNWFRQELAELGVLGSVGWMAWAAMFVWLIIRRHDPHRRGVMVGAAKGGIVGLAAASLLGIPTQDTAASITFVVIACWYMKLTGVDSYSSPANRSRPLRREWAAILLVLGCFLGGTVYEARTELRPPRRALRIAFPYSYGFLPDRNDPTIRWTGAKAVEVFPAEKRWFKLVIGDVAPDAAVKPVRVKVSINREVILEVDRRGNFPITRWVRMPVGGTPLLMQIDVSRTWRPSEFRGGSDERARGVAVREWSFWDEDPPKGSVTFESPPAPMGGEPQ
jgi:hypothetical protein